MRVAVTGASGMLGTAIIDKLSNFFDIFATSRTVGLEKNNINWSCFDVLNSVLLSNWLSSSRPDVIIHCAAIVNVDSCEENALNAYQLHADVINTINDYIKKNSGYLIYISTDSVFDGKSSFPYSEKNHINPINVYSKSKVFGENLTIQNKTGVVLRTNIIGWSRGNALSFSEWILKGLIVEDSLNLFNDVYFSPVHVKTLSDVIFKLIERRLYGIYNVSSDKGISKYNFGILIANEFNLSTKNINQISVDEMNFSAPRPKNMVLLNNKISKDTGCQLGLPIDAIKILKLQYDNDCLSNIKGRNLKDKRYFWK